MFRVSPNGQYISYLKSYNDRQNIWIRSLKDGTERSLTEFSDVGVREYFWSFNNDVVFTRDVQGKENYNLNTINLKTGKITPILETDSVRGRLLFRDQHRPDWIVIAMNKRDESIFDVYRLNVRTGELKLYITNPGNVTNWYPDWQGNIRLAKTSDGVNETLLYRDSDNSEFRPIIINNFKNQVSPLVFAKKANCFYALSNVNRDKSVVVEIDANTGEEECVVYGNAKVDIVSAQASRKNRDLEYVSWDDDRPQQHVLSPNVRDMFEQVRKENPRANIRVLDRDSAEQHYIVATSTDKDPGSYFLYDFSTRKLSHLADLNTAMDTANLSNVKPVTFQASDGMPLRGYLTLPLHSSGKGLPVVVLPHANMWGRNVWGYDAEVQFLANRGYAVFQVNFRGSTGFGKAFHQAGFKQLSGKMQQDITDGVNWLVKEGIADPQRIGIYGSNFGGFSALYQTANHPKLYRCAAVSYGIINLFTYLKDIPPYFKPKLTMMYEMVGNPETDADMFRTASPVFYTNRIRSPLLIFQGEKDPSANINEVNHFVSELRRQKVPVNYVLKSNERKYFRSEHNKIEQYTLLERFLEKNLKAKR
ncbi:MAG: S9 family peptidase [Mucilaginibacter polytrichastri]|nr:S9 family peptidase [Mucilaginibacter polytrichastri]